MTMSLADFPDDVRDALAPHMAESPAMLDAISAAIAARRDEVKSARQSSGIETVWREAEEAYIGVDDANRTEYQGARWSKPMSMDGPVTTGRLPKQTDYKSTAFVRLTARYVDAGAAKLGEILLPADDKAFSFSETPVPELTKAKEDTSQVLHDGMGGVPLTRPAKPGEVQAPEPQPGAPMMGATPAPVPGAASGGPIPPTGSPPVPAAAPAGGAVPPAGAAGGPPQVPLTVKDLAEEAIEMARKKAKAAETRIYDWLVECQYTAEMRKVIFDAARCGVGVVKAPYPKASRAIAVTNADDGGMDIQVREKVAPAAKWVDFWNIFPDQACGENIHLGDFIFERDYLSARQVRDLKKIPGYIAKQIDRVLEEGPDKAVADDAGSGNTELSKHKGRFEIWYYYGTLKPEEMDCLSVAGGKPEPTQASRDKPRKDVYAIITLINNCVIRATINPLDSGAFPYHSVPWQRRAGHWAGIGVAEQVKMPQRTVNAATRAMLNNAGKSAGSQIVIDQSSIKPADGNWTMTPDKIWYKTGATPGDDVRKSFMAIEIPNVTEQLMKIIQYGMQLAEECTSIPLITQGQSGPTTPDTFGAAQLQNNNANQLLRSIGYSFDDYITEPVIRQFNEWLLLDPEVPDEEKGDFTINAHGSIALVERAIQDQTIAQMGTIALNPAYKIDPAKWAKMFFKSKRMDPADFQYTEEQQAKLDATPPTPAPAVQVATINASVQRDKIVSEQQTDQQTAANEQRIAEASHALEGNLASTDATVKLHEIAVRRELAMLDYANKRGMSIDAVKGELAKTAMTLNVQKELNAIDNATDLHKHHNPPPIMKPPTQVPGRAQNGKAFSQA